MQAEEYREVLERLENNLPYMENETAEQILMELFKIKPVRLKWYLVKAQLMIKTGTKIKEIIEFLSDKCQPWYIYEDVEDYIVLLGELAEYSGDMREKERYRYQLNRMKKYQGLEMESKEKQNDLLDSFFKLKWEEFTVREYEQLLDLLYIHGEIYLYILCQNWVKRIADLKGLQEIPDWILEKPNVQYYCERLLGDGKEVFVIIALSQEDEKKCLLAAKAIKALGKWAIVLNSPIEWQEVEDINHNAEKEFRIIKEENGILTAMVYAYSLNGMWTDTREELLEYILKNFTENGLLTILGSGKLIDEMAMKDSFKSKLERLTEANGDYQEDVVAVARYGSYLSYIANIYKMTKAEVEHALYKKPLCKFSIIIPCRTAENTLFYTLKTCLNQSFQGDYEIIISDNSDTEWGMETPIYQLYKQFEDKRIKYYRTPDNLSLMKSFEYAYLKAEGEFLLSMGADDGILPWALEELDGVLKRLPEQQILLWHEISYSWGTDIRTGGAIQLECHADYRKGSPEIIHYSTREIFENSFNVYGNLYYLPQLYHNSGIRREYLGKLYEKTGVLWGGICQDISMAVTIANIESELYFIDNVLTITGISKASIGAQSIVEMRSLKQPDIFKIMKNTIYKGWRVQGYIERLCPIFGGFFSGLYASILYAYAIGAISEERLASAVWEDMYRKIYQELSKEAVVFDQNIHRLRYAVSLHGEQMLEWFDKELYEEALKPVYLEHSIDMEFQDNMPYQGIGMIKIGEKVTEIDSHIIDDVFKVTLLLQKLWDYP